jgi:hypothetical protein
MLATLIDEIGTTAVDAFEVFPQRDDPFSFLGPHAWTAAEPARAVRLAAPAAADAQDARAPTLFCRACLKQ